MFTELWFPIFQIAETGDSIGWPIKLNGMILTMKWAGAGKNNSSFWLWRVDSTWIIRRPFISDSFRDGLSARLILTDCLGERIVDPLLMALGCASPVLLIWRWWYRKIKEACDNSRRFAFENLSWWPHVLADNKVSSFLRTVILVDDS